MLNDNKRHEFHHDSIVKRLTTAKIEKGKARAFAKEFTGGLNLSYSKEYLDYKFRSLVSDMEVSLSRLKSDIMKLVIFVLSLQTIYLSILALMAA